MSSSASEALVDAAKTGDLLKVRELVQSSPELADTRLASGESPLMAALYRGHRDVVHELVERIGTVDIFAAAALGRLDDLRQALGRPGAVNDFTYDGWTPLHLAAFFGALDAAQLLIDAGADLQAVSRNALDNTPLHAATAGGHTEIALLLIERGADVTATDAGRHTPLHIAAESGLTDVVQALLARGADPLAVDADDQTPLSRAAAKNRPEVVDLLNEAS
jgi:ankyrin repeat protein